MASIISYSPQGIVEKALFNFDAMGLSDFKLVGTITVSVSDSFSYADYARNLTNNRYAWTGVPEYPWTVTQVNDIEAIDGIFSSFANVHFSSVTNYDYTPTSAIATPRDVGALSDINISLVHRSDIASLLGQSGGGWNGVFGYPGDFGDIILNTANPILFGDYSFSSTSKLAQVLMHEMGHSLGLAHPHSAFLSDGTAVLTADFSATQYLGFSKLGFQIHSAADMNKEYFTIMSYDDENFTVPYLNAYTPMILDVIALQQAYGEGSGTSGIGNDTITAGTVGYRTYFDKGGIDTVDLSSYTAGAYLNMGVTIDGASHLLGLVVNRADASKLFSGGNPESLRWLYGEYENASGSPGSDLILGNTLNNTIDASGGGDAIDGGDGIDTLVFKAKLAEFSGTVGTQTTIIDSVSSRYGQETLTNIERLSFSDTMLALDIGPKQTAGSVYMLYQAAFNRKPDVAGLGYWINALDQGLDITKDVATFFVSSNEFVAKYGANPMTRVDF